MGSMTRLLRLFFIFVSVNSLTPKSILSEIKRSSIATLCITCLATFPIEAVASGSHESAKITSKVSLDVSIARKPAETIKIGLYGNEAPTATKLFLSVCNGEFAQDVSYDGSQVSRVQKDRRIDVGKFAKGGGKTLQSEIDFAGKLRLKAVRYIICMNGVFDCETYRVSP